MSYTPSVTSRLYAPSDEVKTGPYCTVAPEGAVAVTSTLATPAPAGLKTVPEIVCTFSALTITGLAASKKLGANSTNAGTTIISLLAADRRVKCFGNSCLSRLSIAPPRISTPKSTTVNPIKLASGYGYITQAA